MELTQAIRERRTVRQFASTPIPKALLVEVVDLACWAPSAGGQQGYRFVVAAGSARNEIQARVAASLPQIRHLVEAEFAHDPALAEEVVTFHEAFGGAPVLVLAFAGHDAEGGPEVLSVSAAIQNLLLAAHQAGLGTAWTGFATFNTEIATIVGMAGRPLIGIIPIGYPLSTPTPRPRAEGRVQWLGF
ncbi:nitroreductase family protein [Nocardia sp. 2]|uniref:Nitroreductase family protein n=1 Tax=Nocardia acididurans TaxID=2802282 RepID=A0ABS1MGM8_9NOCA|nr:nitroreductase family protein [Nocardia acididurans]MBL1079717.1 nitroreductase family protein [Nocardia acididurans]